MQDSVGWQFNTRNAPFCPENKKHKHGTHMTFGELKTTFDELTKIDNSYLCNIVIVFYF